MQPGGHINEIICRDAAIAFAAERPIEVTVIPGEWPLQPL